MKVTWYGQSACRLEADAISVITDPYTPETIGYAPIRETADVVITSSDDDDAHCRSDLISGTPIRVNALEIAGVAGEGVRQVGPLHVRAIAAEEWEHHPSGTPGQNAMYRFRLGGLEVAHMGDVGNALNAAQTAFFEGVDVLLAPTGGPPTIRLPDLMDMIHRMRPRLVVPLHFRTLAYKPANIEWIEAFLAHWRPDNVSFAFGPIAEIGEADFGAAPRLHVLDYLRAEAQR